MDRLTVEGIDDELSVRICRLAERDGISLSQAVLLLVRKGAGLNEEQGRPRTIGKSLDHFVGSMSQEEFDELQAALPHFETIDEEDWQSGCSSMPMPTRSTCVGIPR